MPARAKRFARHLGFAYTLAMRILLTTHLPLDHRPEGPFVRALAEALRAAGHEVRTLVVDDAHPLSVTEHEQRVVCSPTDSNAHLPLARPGFALEAGTQQTFADLSDEQLNQYHDHLRQVLDAEINAFDPHIVHAQHVWLLGHLALEAGVPYVVTAWGPELNMFLADRRYERIAQEAAENAGRVFICTPGLETVLRTTFAPLDTEVVAICPQGEVSRECRDQLLAAYRQVLIDRFGTADRP